MGLQIDWFNQVVQVTSPTVAVDVQVLHDFIEDQRAMPPYSADDEIILPEGKIEDPNNPGIFSQIILVFLSPWQIQFWGGSGYTRIFGGKVVGGLNNEPLKATGTAGDITVLESPVDGLAVVTATSGLTAAESAALIEVSDYNTGRWHVVGTQMIFYKADNVTEVDRFDLFDKDGVPTSDPALVYERRRV
jgi:hypothetical protein